MQAVSETYPVGRYSTLWISVSEYDINPLAAVCRNRCSSLPVCGIKFQSEGNNLWSAYGHDPPDEQGGVSFGWRALARHALSTYKHNPRLGYRRPWVGSGGGQVRLWMRNLPLTLEHACRTNHNVLSLVKGKQKEPFGIFWSEKGITVTFTY